MTSAVSLDNRSISDRLAERGYRHQRDERSLRDGKHQIFDASDKLVGRMTVFEAIDLLDLDPVQMHVAEEAITDLIVAVVERECAPLHRAAIAQQNVENAERALLVMFAEKQAELQTLRASRP